MKLKVLELFGGIGACTTALKKLKIDFEVVDYVEIDKYAVKSYNAINNTNFEPQDIMEWDKDIKVDLIMHGSPCQDFSIAGTQRGGDEGSGTRSSLMYETLRIVEKLKPKYVVWENVKNLLSKKHRHNFDSYLEMMEQLGYTNYYQVLNAKDYGVPQNRERVFTISILDGNDFVFPPKQKLKLRLKDMLEDKVDEKYYLNDDTKVIVPFGTYYTWKDNQGNINTQCNRACNPNGNSLTIPAVAGLTKVLEEKCIQVGKLDIKGHDCIKRVYSAEGCSPTLTDMQGGNRQPKIIEKLRIRKLTPLECWRLMGFSDENFERASKMNSNNQLYKQAGNSIVVNVLEAIFRNLIIEKEGINQ